MRGYRGFHDFRKQLAARRLGPGYIFVGREEFWVDEALTALRDALLTRDFETTEHLPSRNDRLLADAVVMEAMPAQAREQLVLASQPDELEQLTAARKAVEAFDFGLFHGRETSVDDILLQTRTAPFLARQRLVVVRDFDRYRKDAQERLLDELRQESKVCRLVLTATGEDRALERLIANKDCGRYVVMMPDADVNEVRDFFDRWSAANRVRIAEDARELLIESTGGSLNQLKSELEKIRTYLGARPTTPDAPVITKEAVRDLTGNWREYEVGEFVAALVRRDRTAALRNLRRLADWSEEPVRIVAWLAGSFMRMLAYPYGDARLWTRPEMVASLRHLSAIDLRLKRGFPEKYYLLENFVLRRAAAARAGGRTQ